MSKPRQASRKAATTTTDRPEWVITSAQLPPAVYRSLVIRAHDERLHQRDIIRKALEAYFDSPLPGTVANVLGRTRRAG